ncbi:MAG: VOC family protein [Anaerolineaceae bacterium]|nr:VOC family protein [Anaerolineaceae bacterium]
MKEGSRNKKIKNCGLHHIAIQTSLWERSLFFYEDVLGMPVIAKADIPGRKLVHLDIGDGSYIELSTFSGEYREGNDISNHGPIIHIGLTTSDVDAAVAQVRQAGFEVTVEPKEMKSGDLHGRFAFVRGLNNELIEFYQEL